MTFPIHVAARSSPLSIAQLDEVLKELLETAKNASFSPHLVLAHGDQDLKTSLRTLDKTDFFTREVDALLLSNTCRIAIHSAKDLPDPIPEGLEIIALTAGEDPSDALILKEGYHLANLPKGALIATSATRREESVRKLRSDLSFCDVRGTIGARLKKLEEGEIFGVVIAQAALNRLKLTHLNAIRLPGTVTRLQGQLAIVAREEDEEMKKLFQPLDQRRKKSALYLGPDLPLKNFQDRALFHCPLIEIKPLPFSLTKEEWELFTHVVFSSKNAVPILINHLIENNIPLATLQDKIAIAVGEATETVLGYYGIKALSAKEETAEGIVSLLKTLPLKNAQVMWPHSALSRPVIEEYLKKQGIFYRSINVYDTIADESCSLPDLSTFNEVIFSSPSTVEAFFTKVKEPPAHLTLTSIGPITERELKKQG